MTLGVVVVPCSCCRRFVAIAPDGSLRDAVPERQRSYFGRRYRGVHRCPAMTAAERALDGRMRAEMPERGA